MRLMFVNRRPINGCNSVVGWIKKRKVGYICVSVVFFSHARDGFFV